MNKINKTYMNVVTMIILMVASFSMLLMNIKTNVTHRYSIDLQANFDPYICQVQPELLGNQVLFIEEQTVQLELEYIHTSCVNLVEINTVDFEQGTIVEIIEPNNNLMAYILGNLI